MNYSAEVERVWFVAAEAEMVEKANGFVDVVGYGAEIVDLFCPIGSVGYPLLLFWFLGCLWGWWLRWVVVSEEEEGKRCVYGFGIEGRFL